MIDHKDKNINKIAMPSAEKIIKEKNLDILDILGTGFNGRVTKGDVLLYLNEIKNIKKPEVTN